jgi:hypothetical protein
MMDYISNLPLNIPNDSGISANNRRYDMDKLYEQFKELAKKDCAIVIGSSNDWDVERDYGIPVDRIIGVAQDFQRDEKTISCSVKLIKSRPLPPIDENTKITIGRFWKSVRTR